MHNSLSESHQEFKDGFYAKLEALVILEVENSQLKKDIKTLTYQVAQLSDPTTTMAKEAAAAWVETKRKEKASQLMQTPAALRNPNDPYKIRKT